MLTIYLSLIEDIDERDLFERMYHKYRKLMFKIAHDILHDEQLAEDAVHQAFLKIIENFEEIKSYDCHKTRNLFVLMSRNHAINIHNYNKRHSMVDLEVVDNTTSTADFALDSEEPLTAAVAKLPDIYRDALTLKYIHEYPDRKSAQMLNISETAFRKRVERAKDMLRKSVGEAAK